MRYGLREELAETRRQQEAQEFTYREELQSAAEKHRRLESQVAELRAEAEQSRLDRESCRSDQENHRRGRQQEQQPRLDLQRARLQDQISERFAENAALRAAVARSKVEHGACRRELEELRGAQNNCHRGTSDSWVSIQERERLQRQISECRAENVALRSEMSRFNAEHDACRRELEERRRAQGRRDRLQRQVSDCYAENVALRSHLARYRLVHKLHPERLGVSLVLPELSSPSQQPVPAHGAARSPAKGGPVAAIAPRVLSPELAAIAARSETRTRLCSGPIAGAAPSEFAAMPRSGPLFNKGSPIRTIAHVDVVAAPREIDFVPGVHFTPSQTLQAVMAAARGMSMSISTVDASRFQGRSCSQSLSRSSSPKAAFAASRGISMSISSKFRSPRVDLHVSRGLRARSR